MGRLLTVTIQWPRSVNALKARVRPCMNQDTILTMQIVLVRFDALSIIRVPPLCRF